MAITDTVTPQWLKDRYLVGVDLTDDEGDPYPDALFTHAIMMAARMVEAELGVSLSPISVVDERHDVDGSTSQSYSLTALTRRPVWEVTAFKVQYGAFPASALPVSWVALRDDMAGQVQLLPSPESLSYSMAGLTGSVIPGLLGGSGAQYVPAYQLYSYEAGYGSEAHPYPEDILALVGLKAAILPLDTAGDLIAGAGIASKSRSMDGISESVNTTSSATNSGYGARVLSYHKNSYKVLLDAVYRDYHPIDMFAL